MTAAQLLLRVGTTAHDDLELVNDLTWDLIETLRVSPANNVARARGEAEDGSKGTPLEWAELVVSFSGGLPAIVGLIRGWVRRQPPGATVRIELDGDILEVSNASPKLQDELTRAFLARHPPAVPE